MKDSSVPGRDSKNFDPKRKKHREREREYKKDVLSLILFFHHNGYSKTVLVSGSLHIPK